VKRIEIGPANGTRALVLHGNDLCAEFYRPLAEALATHGLRTTLVTLPGFAGEAPLPAPSWPAMAEAVRAELDGTRVLIGHSLGGALAWLVARAEPRGLERVVLLEPALLPWRWLADVALDRYRRNVVHGASDRFESWSGTFHRVADVERYPRWAIELYLSSRRASDRATVDTLVGALPGLHPVAPLSQPTCLVRGGASGRLHGLVHGRLARRLGARLFDLPRAGHWLANEDDAALAERMAGFVRG
jgi:pimeloyl-ACP methyl ester carboxylesterase